MTASRRRRVIAALFGVYAGLAFMLTHYPQLTIPVPGRPDLLAHMGLFGLWTIACWSCAWFGPLVSEVNTWRSIGVSMVYAGADEWSQSIPALRRVAALDDFGANALGVMSAGSALMLVSWMARARGSDIIRPPR